MLQHIEQKNLPYTPEQMFDLVADVGSYSDFAPWCIASRINDWDGDNIFFADLIVGYKMFRERFSSRVYLEPPGPDEEGRIYIEYLRGPLRHLKNQWRFIREQDGSCTVDFVVEFEFHNTVLQGLAKMFFNEVIKRMVGAFEARAKALYGTDGREKGPGR